MDGFDGSFVPTTPWADGLSSFQGPSEQYRNQPNGQMMGNLLFEDYDDNLLNFPADDNGVGLNYDVVNPPHFFPANNQIAMESHQCNLTAEELYTLCGGTETGNPAFCVDRGSVGCNDSGPTSSSVFPQEPQSTSGVPRFWGAPTYSCVPPPPLRMDHHHGNLQQFGAMQGGFLNNGGRRFVTDHNGGLQGSSFQTLPNGHCQKNLPNSHTFTPVPQMRSTTSINQVPQIGRDDLVHYYATHAPIPQPVVLLPGNVDNGAPKPRRAKRGQATDPHSIAERLRREKISDRMKSLQELVPNSSKTDKASMLGEIIDYVKFLQLQVKVLSISRVGAAGASTDRQPEESDNLWLSSLEDTNADPLECDEDDDNSEFEQEVVKLMESNVTQAMQFLQTKGLCLMPTTLASAISNRKGSSSAAIPPPPKTKRPVASSTHATSFNNESSMRKESGDRFELPRSCNGTVIKQEDPRKPPTSNCRELNPYH